MKTHLILYITEPTCLHHAAKDHLSPCFYPETGIAFAVARACLWQSCLCGDLKAELLLITSIFGKGPDPKRPLDLKCYALPVVMSMLKDQQSLPLFGVQIMVGSGNLPEIH